MHGSRTTRYPLTVLIAVLTLLLGACGGSEQAGQAGTAPEEPASPAAEGGETQDGATQDPAAEGETGGDAAGSDGGGDWQEGGGQEWEALLEAARQEGGPTVAGPPFVGDALSEAFERDTGIPLNYLGASSRELTSRVNEEARAGNVTIDISLGGGSQLNSLLPEGLLEPLAPQLVLPAATDPESWIHEGIKWLDDEEQYMLQGTEWVHGWVVVNGDQVDTSAVTTWDDLLDPSMTGRIAAYDPRTGGQGQSAAAYLLEAKGEDFVIDLYDGQEMQYTQDSRQLIEWVARGTADVALGAIAPDVERFRAQGINLEVIQMEDAPGALTGGFSVLKQPVGAPNPNSAAVFVNWYAAGPGLEVYSNNALEMPLRTDLDVEGIPEYLRPDRDRDDYIDQYQEDWYTRVRPEISERLTALLGQ